MHARPAIQRALLLAVLPLAGPIAARADDPPSATAPKPAEVPVTKAVVAAVPSNPVITPGNAAEVKRTLMGVDARLATLKTAGGKDNAANRPIVETLERRKQLLDDWTRAAGEREAAEHPEPSPEQVTAGFKAELDKIRTLLNQSHKTPDALLPDAFRPAPAGAPAKPPEARLAEMKEAIDAARAELRERATELQALQGDGSKIQAGEAATLRGARDKQHQVVSALVAGRAEREAAIAAAGSPEARELARERFVNYEWECRVEVERLAKFEAQMALAVKRTESGALQVQARAGRVELDQRLLDLMEKRFASQSEKQQSDLKQAVAKEETRAAHTEDILERYRAKRSADLLKLEAQAVAYEKASATTHANLSVKKQTDLADETVRNFEKLKKFLGDGNISPLDVLRLKNAFRQVGPLRAAITKGELAAVKNELTTYENALADAEIDLVNDARDDRYDRESLLDKLPAARRHEAEVMLDEMEVRRRGLLNRNRDVLQKLAQRFEDTQAEIVRRVHTLDEEYAFIRTHIFWVRDAEPVGPATLAHARDEVIRGVRALGKLVAETGDRTLWGRISPDFILALVGLVALPWPLRLGQRAMDRLRFAAPDPALSPEDAPSPVVG